MAVPARNVSKTRKRMRRTHQKLELPGMIKCTNCGEMIKAHRACPACGFYKGKNVVEKEETKEVKQEEKKPAAKKAPKPKKEKANKDA